MSYRDVQIRSEAQRIARAAIRQEIIRQGLRVIDHDPKEVSRRAGELLKHDGEKVMVIAEQIVKLREDYANG